MYASKRHQERVEARDLKVFKQLFKMQVWLLAAILVGFIIVCVADGLALRGGMF